MTERTYISAGVDRASSNLVKRTIRKIVAPTHGPEVLGGVGGFGAMYRLSGYDAPVLVSSTDGVGTKTKIAAVMGRYEGIGEDVVNACVNDIIVTGAAPLYFLDYIAASKIVPEIVESLVEGMVIACEKAECVLIGGETAEMPGVYSDGDFDIVGFAVGAVEKKEILSLSSVKCGDLVIGLMSSGVHTNGYSLVRDVFGLETDESPLYKFQDVLGRKLGDELLEPHKSYYKSIKPVRGLIKSIAHITGGGLIENLPRALPDDLGVKLDSLAWEPPPIFRLLQEVGRVATDEMFNVFNMGIGMAIVCDRSNVENVVSILPDAIVIGEVISVEGENRVII